MCKTFILVVASFVAVSSNMSFSQNFVENKGVTPNPPETLFDFWVGSWEVSWDEGGGKRGSGTNTVTKIVDDKIICENFQIIKGQSQGFKGTSISVYQPEFKKWKQAWADNRGGYYDFEGEIDGDERIFKTMPRRIDGKKLVWRMVFRNIKKDSLIWDWEKSENGGKVWNLLWRIRYKRIKK